MLQKAGWKHIPKGERCKLCGNISGHKKPGKNARLDALTAQKTATSSTAGGKGSHFSKINKAE